MCDYSYIGPTGKSLGIRCREHVRYFKPNSPISAYASHILKNRHEYASMEKTMELLKTCTKGSKMNCKVSRCIRTHQQQGILIEEQKFNDLNPIYALTSQGDTPRPYHKNRVFIPSSFPSKPSCRKHHN